MSVVWMMMDADRDLVGRENVYVRANNLRCDGGESSSRIGGDSERAKARGRAIERNCFSMFCVYFLLPGGSGSLAQSVHCTTTRK